MQMSISDPPCDFPYAADPYRYMNSSEDDVVQNLMSKGIIDSDVSDILIAMRRFRNIVAHRCGKIDDKIAFSLLENELEDFVLFNERIRAFLKSLVY